jgi:hypothetical protein
LIFAVALQYWPILSAPFSILDDHQIISHIGTDRTFDSIDFFHYLHSQPDFSEMYSTGRFRPTFYFSISASMFLFGLNSILYRLSVIATIAAFSLLLYLTLSLKNYRHISVLIALWFITREFFHDIALRLITSEIYALLPLGVYLLTLKSVAYTLGVFRNKIASNNRELRHDDIFLKISFLAGLSFWLTGIKEVFIVLTIPTTYLTFCYYRKYKESSINKLSVNCGLIILVILATLAILIPPSVFLLSSNDHGYITNNDFIIRTLINGVKFLFYDLHVYLWFILIFYAKHLPLVSRRRLFLTIPYLFLFVFLFFLNTLYYSGSYKTGMRYDLIPYVLMAINYSFLCWVSLPAMHRMSRTRIFGYFSAVLLLALVVLGGSSNRIQAEKSQARAAYYEMFFSSVVSSVPSVREVPVYIHSYNIWDYEVISSLYKNLHFRLPLAKFYFTLDESVEPKTSTEKLFYLRLKSVESRGSRRHPESWPLIGRKSDWGFEEEMPRRTDGSACISIGIGFSGNDHCNNRFIFVYLGF